MNFTDATDDALIEYVQTGMDDLQLAFSELFERYRQTLRTYAESNHSRSPRISRADWISYTMEHFWEAVRKFDTGNDQCMPFNRYLTWKLRKRAFDVIRCKLYTTQRDEADRMVQRVELSTVSLDDITSDSTPLHETIEDTRSLHSYAINVTRTPLYEHIAAQSIEHAEFLRLRVDGYSTPEIASIMGRQGSASSLSHWAKRMTSALQRLTLEFYRESLALDELTGDVEQTVLSAVRAGKRIGVMNVAAV